MPRTGNTSVNNLSFPERPVLVLTDIGDRGDLSVVPEDGDPLSVARHDTSTLLGNLLDATNSDVSVGFRISRHIIPPLHDSTHDVQGGHDDQSDAQECGEKRTGLGLECAKRHMGDE